MAKSDGSVIIDTRMDTKGFSSGAKKLFSAGSSACEKLSSGFRKLGLVVGAALSVGKIIQFGVESSKAARELSDALTGLQSVVEGQGRSFADAKAFIDEYTSDGLIPAANAITAYKNLASRGYDDGQIRQTMIALKDAAAFGRRSALSMGDAVKSATEGLRNENSMLVDNAGVTKNVAKMWDDYAASIGTTANNLTQQQKIQAEVAGILEETKFQTGDAAKVSGTLSGQLQQLSFNFNNLKIAVGGIVNPIVQYVLPAINTAIQAFTRLANAVGQVVGLLFGKVSTSGGLAEQNNAIAETAIAGAEAEKALAKETESAGKAAKKALAGFDELNVLQSNTGGGGSGSGVGAVGGGGGGNALGNSASVKVEDTISPELKKIADKIKKILKPLQNIKFDAAKKSVEKLGKAFKSFGGVIEDALEWAWEEILVPLAEWTIEEAGPKSVDVLAAALKLVTAATKPMLEGIKKIKTSLEPTIKFIKETALIVLDKWKSGFQKIADKFEEKAPEIEETLDNLGKTFKAIWKVIEPILKKMRENWEKTMDVLFDEVAEDIELSIDTWNGFSKFLLGVFTLDWETAWDGIETIFKEFSERLEEKAEKLEEITGIPFTNIYKDAKKKFTNIKDKVLDAWKAIEESEAWQRIEKTLKTQWSNIRDDAIKKFGKIQDSVSDAWAGSKKSWEKAEEWFSELFGSLKETGDTAFSNIGALGEGAWIIVKEAWGKAKEWFRINVAKPIAKLFADMDLSSPFQGVLDWIKKKFKLGEAIGEALNIKGVDFSEIGEKLKDAFKDALNKLIDGLNSAIGGPIKKLNLAIMELKYKKVFDTLPFQGLKVLPVPKIPHLAKGAVIPPNAPFMAMLGDQRHGTNIEAPLSTIQEAVALVLDDMTGGLMAGFEATVAVLREILEAILGIEIGDTVIAEAVTRYNRKMSVVKGG